MRENRYRGKSVDNGNWIYGSLVTVDSYYGDDWNGAYILPKVLDYAQNFDRNAAEVIAETVGQFTGLKDKNGVDIYEGDKVKGKYYSGKIGIFNRIVGEISFRHGCFEVSGLGKYEGLKEKLEFDYEVISNIHEVSE